MQLVRAGREGSKWHARLVVLASPHTSTEKEQLTLGNLGKVTVTVPSPSAPLPARTTARLRTIDEKHPSAFYLHAVDNNTNRDVKHLPTVNTIQIAVVVITMQSKLAVLYEDSPVGGAFQFKERVRGKLRPVVPGEVLRRAVVVAHPHRQIVAGGRAQRRVRRQVARRGQTAGRGLANRLHRAGEGETFFG